MKLSKHRISVRHLLMIAIGWVHCALLFSPIYALLLNFTNDTLTREVVIRNHLRGLLILVPVALSWFAARYLRNIFLYLLASVGICTLNGFLFDTPVLIIAQPTRGVDIGAIEFIHKQIIDKRNQGCAILLVSADLDEIFRLSDRIITMFEGKVTGEFRSGEIDKMEISYYMTGHRDGEGGQNDN